MHQSLINYRATVKILGAIILITGLAMLVPLAYAVATQDHLCAEAFGKSAPPALLIGTLLLVCFKSTNAKFRTRDGYLVVALCWIVASFIGAFPYYFSTFADSFVDAFFESTSGFTTTGCTAVSEGVLTDSLLLWKAFSHWLGGMGILIFVISILPALGINGQFIARAEAPGPVFEKMAVRISDSTKILYITYIILTAAESILLALSPEMDIFEAIVNSMGSISTGGLLVHTSGISFYNSFYVEVVISLFCVLASTNFILYHYIAQGDIKRALRDAELRVFLLIMVIGIAVCTIGLYAYTGDSLSKAFRDSFFQVISMSTTTGYVRSPYVVWPVTCQMILFSLMLIGGCSASTAGSVKVVRFILMFKLVVRGTYKRVHPRSVVPVKMNDRVISSQVVSGMCGFILTYLAIFLFSGIIISLQGLDLETTLGTVLAMLSNTGAAFGVTASAGNFAAYAPALKLYLCLLMYIGRLEIYTILVLFTRHFWNKTR